MKDIHKHNSDQQSYVVPQLSAKATSDKTDRQYSQFLFDTLRTAVLYLDQWGRIRSANAMAKKLFGSDYLAGKTALEVLDYWESPIHAHQEVLSVARTGHSITGLVEKVIIDHQERWFQTDKIAVENAEHGFNGVVFTLDEITTLKQHQMSLAKSEASYRAFVENSQDAIWRFDLQPPIPLHSANGRAISQEQLIEQVNDKAVMGDCNNILNDLYNMDDSVRLSGVPLADIPFNTAVLDVETFVKNDLQIRDKDIEYQPYVGENRYFKVSAQGIIDQGNLVSIWGVTKDRTESKRYIERLEYQNTHDLLTGLPNRVLLQRSVEYAIVNLERDKKIALMIIDLDSFKEINDTLGHDVGDRILKGLGSRMSDKLKGIPSTIARLGGDEFAILLSDVEHLEDVEKVSRSLLSCIRQYFYIDDIEVEIRASIGISIYPDQADNFSTLLRYADVAMYCAKKDMAGAAFYNADNDLHSPKRLSLMSELGKAIREDGLCLYFQPKVSLESDKIVGAEVLARWIHPTMGFISPTEFVPIAEMTDLINDMTRWVLNESLRQVSQWRLQSFDISIAVNISARNLLQEDFCEMVKYLLFFHDVPPSKLELEITESTVMRNTEKTLLILKELNEIGVELSIDDFGTGYSSLAYLKRLPVKRLKIDYSFIINMLENEQDQIIVSSTINMAHNLGLLVVAEGVENKEIMQILSNMRCEQAQGFHIAKPMPASELEQWCSNYS